MSDRMRNTAILIILASLLLSPLICGASVVIVGPLIYEHELHPGRTAEGTFEVRNVGERPQEVKCYQTDYFFFADGRALYGEPGKLPRSNARWITWAPKQLVIPPKESLKLRYTIQVPDDATLTGTYWSMLMVEPVAAGSPESTQKSPDKLSIGVQQVVRYGIQVAVHIGNTGSRQLKFSQIRLSRDNGEVILAVDVENSGERMLPAELWAELYDPNGAYVGKFNGGKRRLYPGTSSRYTVNLIGLIGVTYKSLIVVDCGGDDVFGASASLKLER